jgi:hypothetical protein
MYKKVLQHIKKISDDKKYVNEEKVYEICNQKEITIPELNKILYNLGEAGFLAKCSSSIVEYHLTQDGETLLSKNYNPGQGIILDEPYSSALLRIGLKKGLIKTYLKNPYAKIQKELAKGLSPIVQEKALLSLLLFENVLIPSDKVFEEYFDWSEMMKTYGIRVAGYGPGPKEMIREESFRIWLKDLSALKEGDLSGWDNITQSYLLKRGIKIEKEFIKKNLIKYDHQIFVTILEFGTREEKLLYLPELIEYRLKRSMAKGLFRTKDPFSDMNSKYVYDEMKKLFWLFETFFHLRYLKRLSHNPYLPSVVKTSIGSVSKNKYLSIDINSDAVYSIFLDEIHTLPRPRTLEDIFRLRNSSSIKNFREVFHEWHKVISIGDLNEEQKFRNDLNKISKDFKKLDNWKSISGIMTYIGLPAAVFGTISAEPIVGLGGLCISLIGGVSQAWVDVQNKKNNWLLFGIK